MPEAPLKLAIRPNPAVKFTIVHEDADLLVIDKPVGLVVQPGKGHTSDSLLNGLFALKGGLYGKLLHNLGSARDYGLLHRLDKDTSGLLVVAKLPNAYDQLRRDFEDRKIDKEYLTIVLGTPEPKQGVVQARLKEITDPGSHMKKVIISRQGQEAISAYQVLSTATIQLQRSEMSVSLVRVRIKTGRLHQIRAHMLYLNTSVLGDDLYAPLLQNPSQNSAPKNLRFPRPPRLCLHAAHLGFKHPTSGKWLHLESPLTSDLANYAEKLNLKLPPAKQS